MTTEPWVTAYHEAGHAVAARALGLVVTRVTIEPRYDTFYRKWRIGTTEIEVIGNHATDYSGEMRDRLRREAIFSLAGNAAERRAFDRPLLEEDHTDSDVAEWLLSRDTPQRDLPRLLRRAQAIADRLVTERWSETESLAAALTNAARQPLRTAASQERRADSPVQRHEGGETWVHIGNPG